MKKFLCLILLSAAVFSITGCVAARTTTYYEEETPVYYHRPQTTVVYTESRPVYYGSRTVYVSKPGHSRGHHRGHGPSHPGHSNHR